MSYLIQPETTLWEVMFWWLPDLDDEDDDEEEDDEGNIKRVKTKRGEVAHPPRGLRNKQLTDKLLKRRDGKLKDRRAKKNSHDKIREKGQTEDAADEEEERKVIEESGLKNNPPEEHKVKRKTLKAWTPSTTEDLASAAQLIFY